MGGVKRKLLLLTDGEIGTLRAAIRTAQEEECGTATFNRYQRVLDKIESAPPVTRGQWLTFEDAAGEMLEANADEAYMHIGHRGVRWCKQFAEAMHKAFGRK